MVLLWNQFSGTVLFHFDLVLSTQHGITSGFPSPKSCQSDSARLEPPSRHLFAYYEWEHNLSRTVMAENSPDKIPTQLSTPLQPKRGTAKHGEASSLSIVAGKLSSVLKRDAYYGTKRLATII